MGSQSATYSYVANSPLVEQIALKQSGSSVMTTTKSYDYLNRLRSISSSPSVSYTDDYNTAGQRVRSMLGDGSSWLYEYVALGQVRSGRNYWSDGSPVGGQQFEYAFDDIGNRTSTKVGGDADGQNLRAASYTANNLNDYTSRSVPGAVYVTGMALATNPVTVNTLATSRKGEYFWKELLTNNSSAPIWMTVTASAAAETSVAGNVFIPKTTEQFYHDADGNLTNDGRWTFTWDAENRLVRLVAKIRFLPPTTRERRDMSEANRKSPARAYAAAGS